MFLARLALRLTCLAGLLVWLGLCSAPAAQAAEAVPTTALEAGPFSRATAVLSVRVTDVRDIRSPGGALGQQIVRCRVLKTLKGTVTAGDEVALMVVGQRPTLDPARPSVPYFRKGKHVRYVVFLARGRGRHAWQLQTLYDAEGRVGAEKVAAVTAVATWAAIRDGKAKARQTLLGLIGMLRGRGRWTRPHAARELAYLAQVHPEVFNRGTLGQLNRMAAIGGDQDLRFWLRRVVQILQQHKVDTGEASAAAEASGGDPWREAFEAAPGSEDRRLLLGRLLAAGAERFEKHGWWAWVRMEPSSRVWLLEALVHAERRSAVAKLRVFYGSAVAPEVREGIVRTVGLLGGDGDVAWLAERLASKTARRTALIALARVRTPAALKALEAARKTSPPEEALWIDYLLSPAFEATDGGGR